MVTRSSQQVINETTEVIHSRLDAIGHNWLLSSPTGHFLNKLNIKVNLTEDVMDILRFQRNRMENDF